MRQSKDQSKTGPDALALPGKDALRKSALAAPKDAGKSGVTERETPAPPLRLRMRLSSIGDVKLELARLYRETRANKVATQDASRMANMLLILGRLIEGSDVEARLDALETQQRKENPTWSTQH